MNFAFHHRDITRCVHKGQNLQNSSFHSSSRTFSGQTGVRVVEHTVASTWTPLPVLWKELFCPSLPLYHQGRWPHRARGRQALVFLWRQIWLCRLPESISGPPGVHGHCLMQSWGHLHRHHSPENMAGTCHPLKSLAYYIKVKKTIPSCICFAYKWKYTCMHTPFPPLPSWSLPEIKGQKFRKNWTFFLQETSLFSKLQKSKYWIRIHCSWITQPADKNPNVI